jgi:uncharacterized membrane protein YkoI
MIKSIYKLYPQVVSTDGDIAYDADGNEVAYDLQAVTAQAQADAQTEATAKTAALAKLTALGLTPADLTALGL